mmetsp:Transcript_31531/g.48272  ORF Transcript_31531/g.48272 Transcript_31531/m.48272 type:complete len:166 (+) Transcript_31531:102-599(+)
MQSLKVGKSSPTLWERFRPSNKKWRDSRGNRKDSIDVNDCDSVDSRDLLLPYASDEEMVSLINRDAATVSVDSFRSFRTKRVRAHRTRHSLSVNDLKGRMDGRRAVSNLSLDHRRVFLNLENLANHKVESLDPNLMTTVAQLHFPKEMQRCLDVEFVTVPVMPVS